LGAWAGAGSAGALARNFDLFPRPLTRFLHFYGVFFGEMVAALLAGATAAAAEELAEDIAEDVFKTTTGEVKSTARGATVTECRMAKLVVLGAFLRVGKNGIGFGNLLELFFCLFVAWIAVRMILQR
jgi:hypothetical protein